MAVCTASVVTPAPPTAGRKVKICASVASAIGRRLGDARAGPHQFDRRHRLDQKVGDAHLHQPARDGLVEALRDGDDRRPGADPQHQPLERRQFGFVGGIDVDDDDGGAVDVDLAVALGEPALDDVEADLRAGAERGADGLLERRRRRSARPLGRRSPELWIGRYA